MAKKNIFNNRRFKYGSLATALTVSMIAVVVILNIVCTMLTTNYSLKLDITGDDLYKLNIQTLQIIDKTEKEVSFTVLADENDYPTQFKEILRRITLTSDLFSLKFVDPDKNPTFASSFGSQYDIQAGALIMQCGKKIRVVQNTEMYEADTETGSITYLLEERVASALFGFMQERDEKIYFVTGHGESSDGTFRSLFSNNGYTVEDIRLYEGMKFDPAATLMVIVAPSRDYSVGEVSAVEAFLTNNYEYGKNLMFFSSAASVALPNLEALLHDWGIALNRDMIVESDASRYIGLPTTFQPDVSSNDLTENLRVNNVPTVMVAARSVSPRFESNGNLTVAPVLVTTDASYGKQIIEEKPISTYAKEEGDTAGPLNVAVLSQLLKVYNNQNVYSNVFACGSADMLLTDYMAYANNGDFMLNVYDLMMQREGETVLDSVKYTAGQTMVLSDGQKTTINVVAMGVIPGIVLILGIIVFIRRRYL
ncbi:MAG: Gldg family protein [Clostridia bacterium]|nr:Gldg family protein [Clostridia bacterium]